VTLAWHGITIAVEIIIGGLAAARHARNWSSKVIEASAGSFVYGPLDVPHTFAVDSDVARFLLVAQPAGFERFVRAVGEPAQALTIPPPPAQPPDPERLTAVAADYGNEILGPPAIPA